MTLALVLLSPLVANAGLVNGSLEGPVNPHSTSPPEWVGLFATPDTTSATIQPTYPLPSGTYFSLVKNPGDSPDGGTWAGLAANNGDWDRIGQTVTDFVVGETYEVSWYETNTGIQGGSFNLDNGQIGFALNGTTLFVGEVRAKDGIWHSQSVSFVATSTSHQLEFFATHDGGRAYMGIDGISLVIASNPDADGDGVPDGEDICQGGDDALDADADGTPDFCDEDDDNDGFLDVDDTCAGGNDGFDDDADGVPNFCDICPFDATNDGDGDGSCGALSYCVAGVAAVDTDGDDVADSCDVCPLDAANDADDDGICETGEGSQLGDNCPIIANENQSDIDGDGLGDVCDPDIDGDGIVNVDDNCVFDYNDQTDTDLDGQGDACDDDLDGDGVNDAGDACVPSPVGDPVDATGCAVVELCPCDNNWKNHGAYVKCVAHTANDFVELGLISDTEHDDIVSAAGQSSCGAKQ